MRTRCLTIVISATPTRPGFELSPEDSSIRYTCKAGKRKILKSPSKEKRARVTDEENNQVCNKYILIPKFGVWGEPGVKLCFVSATMARARGAAGDCGVACEESSRA